MEMQNTREENERLRLRSEKLSQELLQVDSLEHFLSLRSHSSIAQAKDGPLSSEAVALAKANGSTCIDLRFPAKNDLFLARPLYHRPNLLPA